jgi:hypothetical protein
MLGVSRLPGDEFTKGSQLLCAEHQGFGSDFTKMEELPVEKIGAKNVVTLYL